MWKAWRHNSGRPHDSGAPGPRGLVIFAVTLAILYASLSWLRDDQKFSGAIQLTAALRYVLSVGTIDATPDEVFQAAASGLTSTLDPFSAYMPADELGYFEEETGGEYVGIGVEIKMTLAAIVIVRVLPQTSAAEAMIEPGDRIVAIDDTPTTGFTLRRAIELMRGPEGSAVSLRIQSPAGEERHMRLERRAVSVSPFPVHGISHSGAAYIRWTDFSAGSADRLAAIVEALSIESPVGLILDLRGNPGGLLDEAVNAAGVFLPPNVLVCRVIDRTGQEKIEYRTGESPATFPGPVVIVMDEDAASASEVLAAALQETGRAVVVGRRSFGKGWVQSVFPFDDGSALRLSTARYYTPGGHSFGDPSALVTHDETETPHSSWFAPSGLIPDSTVAALPVGPWEETFAEMGLFADFAITYSEEWPADDLIETLRLWSDSLSILPDGLLANVTGGRESEPMTSPDGLSRADWHRLLSTLDSAHVLDQGLLFERESTALSLCLWEQRMVAVERPDEAELEEYLSLDPDLSAARELLEDSARYDDFIHRRRLRAPTASAEPR